jgi:replication factor C large subunit
MSYWKYLKYAIALSTIGVSMAKDEPYRKFTKYSFPSYLKAMSQTIIRRAMRKKIGLKIGAKVHTNRKQALEYLPLIKEMSRDKSGEIADYFEFVEDELAFIMETSPRKIRKK